MKDKCEINLTNEKIINALENKIFIIKKADDHLLDDVKSLKDMSKSKKYKKACDDIIKLVKKV